MSYRSIYYATNKDIYDLLVSSGKRINVNALRALAAERGIYFSARASREEMAEYLSDLNFSSDDLESIVLKTKQRGREEKYNTSYFDYKPKDDELSEVTESVVSALKQSGNVVSCEATATGFELDLQYTEFDLGKTRLKQKEEKEAKVEIYTEDGKVKIRGPVGQKIQEVKHFVEKELKKKTKDLQVKDISLEEVMDAQLRSKFFENLLSSLKGYRLEDVTKVKLERFQSEASEDQSEDDDDLIDNAEATGVVSKALFEGRGLLYSNTFKGLTAKGYYISGIAWTAEEKQGHNRIGVEAGFKEPTECVDFFYKLARVSRKDTNNQNADRFNHRPPTMEERKSVLSLLEAAANKSHKDVLKQLKRKNGAKA